MSDIADSGYGVATTVCGERDDELRAAGLECFALLGVSGYAECEESLSWKRFHVVTDEVPDQANGAESDG